MILSAEMMLVMVLVISVASVAVYLIYNNYSETVTRIQEVANARDNRLKELILVIDSDYRAGNRIVVMNHESPHHIKFASTWMVNMTGTDEPEPVVCLSDGAEVDDGFEWEPQKIISISCTMERNQDLVFITSNYKSILISGQPDPATSSP